MANFPTNTEVCDNQDNDCDYQLSGDEQDDDGDGQTECNGDCDDTAPLNFDGNSEVCDRQDNDCDGITPADEVDDDADGQTECEGDCDDGDPDSLNGGTEVLDGADNDCEGTTDRFGLGGADAVLGGEDAGDFAGSAVAFADVNGDGYDDVVVGAEGEADSAGAVYVVLGSAAGIGTINLSAADAKLTGEVADDEAGSAVAAGDVNGDGYADIIVGSKNSGGVGLWAGAAYVALGGPTGIASSSLADVDAKLTGAAAYDTAGTTVAVGDVNNDGYDDVLVGASGGSPAGLLGGGVYLVLGSLSGVTGGSLASADAILTGEATGDNAGKVAFAGDVNGDGYGDVVVGASGNASTTSDGGAAYIVYGSSSGLPTINLASADAKLSAEDPSDMVGYWVATAGDSNGDGYADVVVGAGAEDSVFSGAGAAYIVHGSSTGISSMNLSLADTKVTGEAELDEAGRILGPAGDLDGDGFDDVLVGAEQNDEGGTYAGAVYLLRGSAFGVPSGSLSAAAAKLIGEADIDKAGSSVAGAGDTDGDGHLEILVGARLVGADNEGAVFLLEESF